MLSLVVLYDLLETTGWRRPAKVEYCDESAEHVMGRRCRSNDSVEEITMRDTRLLVLLLAETESGDFILPMAWARFLAPTATDAARLADGSCGPWSACTDDEEVT
jgi:hypothetical protein